MDFVTRWSLVLGGATILLIWGWIMYWLDVRRRNRPH